MSYDLDYEIITKEDEELYGVIKPKIKIKTYKIVEESKDDSKSSR